MCFSQGARMVFERVSRLASIPALVLGVFLWLATAVPSAAVSLIRDADIEHGLTELAFPILRAAGLSPTRVRVLVVNSSAFNAFVLDTQTIYLNYGLIQKVTNARMLQAVIAHEAAHIANGHLSRRIANFQSARTVAGIGALLAVAAAAAGGGEGAAAVGIGISSSATRSFLGHTRAEESSADRSAASYLRNSGIDPQGLVELHQAFAGQELLSVANQDPYTRSHPLSRDRVRAAKAFVAANGGKVPSNLNAEYWFSRLRGKLTAYTRSPKWTFARATDESEPDIHRMREAVAYHRLNNLGQALSSINAALAMRPDDPFYYDLKGQILMENRQWATAVSAYQKAVDLAPNNSLILAGLGRAQRAAGQRKAGLETLEKARLRDFRNLRLLQDLSLAYAQDDRPGLAALSTAERYALLGNLPDAGLHARRALAQLPRGSVAAQRAEDVLIASEKFDKRKKR